MLEEQIQNAIQELKDSKKTNLCEELIRTQGVQSPTFAQAAFKAGILRPAILYQDASPEIRDKLIELLDQEDEENLGKLRANDCLVALAMIGDDTVAEYFKSGRKIPGRGASRCTSGRLSTPKKAGGALRMAKKSPVFEECYALEKSENTAPEDNLFGGAAPEKCPYCDSSYVNMLVIDGRDEDLSFLGIDGKIKVKYCPGCLPWTESIFCRYTEDGESTVITHEGGEDYFVEDEDINAQTPFVLSKKMVPKSYCEEFERCAIGGRPAFVDDADYTVCPECGKFMIHLAQFGEELSGCGTHYIQICRDCKLATVRYQQT